MSVNDGSISSVASSIPSALPAPVSSGISSSWIEPTESSSEYSIISLAGIYTAVQEGQTIFSLSSSSVSSSTLQREQRGFMSYMLKTSSTSENNQPGRHFLSVLCLAVPCRRRLLSSSLI